MYGRLSEAASRFETVIGKPLHAIKLTIGADYATLRGQDPDDPERYNEYVYGDPPRYAGNVEAPTRVTMTAGEIAQVQKYWFELEDIHLAEVAAIPRRAIKRAEMAAAGRGEVTSVMFTRGAFFGRSNVQHRLVGLVHVTTPTGLAVVVFDATGKYLETILP